VGRRSSWRRSTGRGLSGGVALESRMAAYRLVCQRPKYLPRRFRYGTARLFPIIVLFSLVTVEYGGWALLGFLTGQGARNAFRRQFFRAGHAHAGVLLVLSRVYFIYLGRAGYSTAAQWIAGALLLAPSEGFFVHLGMGGEGRSSAGTMLTRTGALLLAVG
jgi:hypothetical protein